MHDPITLTNAVISQWLEATYNLENATLAFTATSDCSWAYTVRIKDKPQYVLKLTNETICGVSPTREAINARMTLYHDHGIQQMQPPPKRAKTGKYLNDLEGYRAQLLPYVAGKTQDELTVEQARELGLFMARLHRCKISIAERPPQEDFGATTITAYQQLLAKADEPMGVFMPTQSKLLKRLRDIRTRLGERYLDIETLRAKLMAKQDPDRDYVVCHSAPTSPHIIINDRGVLRLSHWDGIRFAPRERDLWSLQQMPAAMEAYQTRMSALNVDAKPDASLLRYYQQEHEIQKIVDYGRRILSDTQTEVQNQRDYDALEKHLKGIGL